jgi:competence protein ComEC
VNRLDGVVISHADDDHAGGAFSVADARDPAWLLSPLAAGDPLHAMFERSIRCEAGMRWRWDGVDFTMLHPAAAVYAEERAAGKRARKENDRSCVVRVATASSSALLTGDAEARSEQEMLARDARALRADVLLIPHHGSKTSSTDAFIDAVGPAIGLLSVGYRNRFHHPNAAVVERYGIRHVRLHRTDAEGALHVTLPAASATPIGVEGYAREVRYWSERR